MTDPLPERAILDALDAPTRALVVLAAAIAAGSPTRLEAACRAALEAGVPPLWVDELLLQSVLMVGWPRALVGADTWRRVSGRPAVSIEDGGDYRRHEEWEARGKDVCRTIYEGQYDRLRENVCALHPALERWMLVDGYGRTIGRPGLDLARRELCVVAQVAVQGAERQLHSHLKGAVRAGAAPEAVDETLVATFPFLGPSEHDVAVALWERVRE
jgi:4-carboxymuconolactone decarboxylase